LERGKEHKTPLDGDIWIDPLHSSYPPSIAFKAAQIQSNDKAISFKTFTGNDFIEKRILANGPKLKKLL
jgi:hypothetical protein